MHQDIGVHLYWMLNDNEEWVKICCTFTSSPGSINIIVVATLLPGWQVESYGSASWDCFLPVFPIPPLPHMTARNSDWVTGVGENMQLMQHVQTSANPLIACMHSHYHYQKHFTGSSIFGARGNNKGCCIQVINWLSHFSPCGESWQAWCSLNCWWENVGGVLETSHATLRN